PQVRALGRRMRAAPGAPAPAAPDVSFACVSTSPSGGYAGPVDALFSPAFDEAPVARRAAPEPMPAAAPAPKRGGFFKKLFAREADESTAASDRLYDVLLTQEPDGSFRWSDALAGWLGARAATVRAAAKPDEA